MISKIYEGDCLKWMQTLLSESIDLIYIDPPFNTGKKQKANDFEYEDRWDSIHSYVAFMKDRLEQMHRLLKPRAR